jgi:hypothetical protein
LEYARRVKNGSFFAIFHLHTPFSGTIGRYIAIARRSDGQNRKKEE